MVSLALSRPRQIWESLMMASSNGNIFRVTGHLCREFTGPGEFPVQRPVARSFDVFFDLRPNKPLSKQWWGWWFETLSRPLWRHCNAVRSQSIEFHYKPVLDQLASWTQRTFLRNYTIVLDGTNKLFYPLEENLETLSGSQAIAICGSGIRLVFILPVVLNDFLSHVILQITQ